MLKKVFNLVRKSSSSELSPLIGQVFMEETVRSEQDGAQTTIKNLFVIESLVSSDVAKAKHFINYIYPEYHYGMSWGTKHIILSEKKIITQNGTPIKLSLKGSFERLDPDFEKNGYAKDQLYSFCNLGPKKNPDEICRVNHVTDQYVSFDGLDPGSVSNIYTFDELERLDPKMRGSLIK